MERFIERRLGQLSRLLVYATALSLAAMMLQVFADVVLKYLFKAPIPGTTEIVAHYYMVAVVFLPMPYVEMRNSGISVDLVYNMFGSFVRRAMLVIAYLGQIVFFGLLAYQSSIDAWKSFEIREYVSAQIVVTIWPATFFLPLGFILATLVSLMRLAQILSRPDWEAVCLYAIDEEPDRPVQEAS